MGITWYTTAEEKIMMDSIYNFVVNQKQNFLANPTGFRERLIEALVKNYGEKYRQFITDTVYRELRFPGEPAYKAPSYKVYYPGIQEKPPTPSILEQFTSTTKTIIVLILVLFFIYAMIKIKALEKIKL